MKPVITISLIKQIAASLFLLFLLLWLTVSTPFIYASRQALKIEKQEQKNTEKAADASQTNASEEKVDDTVNGPSEYLHELSFDINHFSTPLKHEKCHPSDIYFAYHPELISPPPEL